MAGSILPSTDGIKTTCPLPQTNHFGAILKLTSYKIIVETFSGVEHTNKQETNKNNPLTKVYLVFSPRDAIIIGKLPGFDAKIAVEKNFAGREEVDKLEQVEKSIVAACKFVFLVKSKELEAVEYEDGGPALTASVNCYVLGKHKTEPIVQSSVKNNEVKDDGVASQTVKPELVIKFVKDCHLLNMLHQGHMYYVYESKHVNNTCQIEHALERNFPIIYMCSNIRIEEIDDEVQMRDDYGEWVRMAEPLIKMESVRAYLSTWENRTVKNE